MGRDRPPAAIQFKKTGRDRALRSRSGRGNLCFIIIMRVSLNANIRREINFYDKKTCWGKGISKQNLFSQNISLGPIYWPPMPKVFFRPSFR